MKKFRIARCISEDGKSIERYAIFKDRSRRRLIQVDDKGREYFEVDNWIQSNPELDEFNYGNLKDRLKYSFNRKPEDMISSIKRGYGDVISVRHILVRLESVLYFLDREYGESLRKKTIEGWKQTKFGYVLYFDSIALNKNSGDNDRRKKDVFFNNYEDAIKLAERIIENAMEIANKIQGFTYKDNPYLSFIEDVDNPAVELVFDQFEEIYDEEDVFKRKEGVTRKTLLSKFKIYQEPIPREEE